MVDSLANRLDRLTIDTINASQQSDIVMLEFLFSELFIHLCVFMKLRMLIVYRFIVVDPFQLVPRPFWR